MNAMTQARAGASVADARRRVAQAFRTHGLDSPDLDARLIVGHALGLDHAALAAASARQLTPAEADAIDTLATRRLSHEPVARILGSKEFWGLPFALNAETLVPRPETETVVEAALDMLARDGARGRALRIADLGTGSGALLLALLSELPAATGIGTDISAAAIACARDNAEALGFAKRAAFVVCDFGAALAGPFDLVVSNPPYVAQGEIAALAPEVRLYDPPRALDGGPDGLAAYRAIAAAARGLLQPGGLMVLELGAGQLAPVAELFMTEGHVVNHRNDLASLPRALIVKHPS